MKKASLLLLGLVFGSALFFDSSLAEAAKKARSKKASRSNNAQPVSENGKKLPTKLPSYKGKKKVSIDFENNSGTHTTTVVVRTPLPLEKALEDSADARAASQNSSKAIEIKPAPFATPSPKIELAGPPEPFDPETPDTFLPPTKQLPKAPSAREASKSSRVSAPVRAAAPPQPLLVPVPQAAPGPQPSLAPQVTAKPQETSAPRIQAVPHSSATVATKVSPAQRDDEARSVTRISARTSYVSARYSELEGRLENGATTLGLGVSRQQGSFEARASLDFGHGLDQSVTPQNTRFVLARLDAAYFFTSGGVAPFAGAGLGYADLNVRSYRSSSSEGFVIREHLKSSAFLFAPNAGLRFSVGETATIDLTGEYLGLFGGQNVFALGGWTGALSVGFAF